MLNQIIEEFSALPWQDRIKALGKHTNQAIAFSTSLSYEDQVITHLIADQGTPVKIFTLDTGRLFEETHKVAQETREKYKNISIETFYPDAAKTQDLVRNQGINGFFDSVENRKNCCGVRKVEPLNRALQGVDIWISGLRRAHSENREDLPIAEMDEGRGIIKLYPLIDVEEDTLKDYIRAHDIPYNELHDRGFPSIGCAPCTRAIKAGEPMRAGRWWWEAKFQDGDNAQECGLHMVDGKLVRVKG